MLKSTKSGIAAMSAVAMLCMSLFGPASAQTSRSTGMQITSDKPVQIEGDKLEVIEEQGMAVFSGNVRVSQDDTVLRTGRLTIRYAGNAAEGGSLTSGASQIESLEATGGVNIQSGTQVATGETGVFDMQSQVLVLSGKQVTLSEDGNVATGCKLTVAMQSGRATLSGCGDAGSRPTILLQPRSFQDSDLPGN